MDIANRHTNRQPLRARAPRAMLTISNLLTAALAIQSRLEFDYRIPTLLKRGAQKSPRYESDRMVDNIHIA